MCRIFLSLRGIPWESFAYFSKLKLIFKLFFIRCSQYKFHVFYNTGIRAKWYFESSASLSPPSLVFVNAYTIMYSIPITITGFPLS